MIWKRRFASPIVKASNVRDVDFSRGRPAHFPIKAVMTEKYIHVLNNEGETARRIDLRPYAEISMSDDGSTMAGLQGRRIVITDINGRLQGIVNLAEPQPEVLPQHIQFKLAPNGQYLVVVSSFSNNIYFHSRNGDLLATHRHDDLDGANVQFSASGQRLAVHIPNWKACDTEGRIRVFDKEGRALSTLPSGKYGPVWKISDNGEFLVTVHRGNAIIRDCEGGQIVHQRRIGTNAGGVDISEHRNVCDTASLGSSSTSVTNESSHIHTYRHATDSPKRSSNMPRELRMIHFGFNNAALLARRQQDKNARTGSVFLRVPSSRFLWRTTDMTRDPDIWPRPNKRLLLLKMKSVATLYCCYPTVINDDMPRIPRREDS